MDDAIDQCSAVYNLRETIDLLRVKSEEATEDGQKKHYSQKGTTLPCSYSVMRFNSVAGLQNLRRYFELIVFQAYLQSTIPDTMQSFESIETFVKARPGTKLHFSVVLCSCICLISVIKTFEKELIHGGIGVLQPLVGASAKGDMASPDEVTQVVMNRTGSILSASTILKSDFFSNLQKMTLPEYVCLEARVSS